MDREVSSAMSGCHIYQVGYQSATDQGGLHKTQNRDDCPKILACTLTVKMPSQEPSHIPEDKRILKKPQDLYLNSRAIPAAAVYCCHAMV